MHEQHKMDEKKIVIVPESGTPPANSDQNSFVFTEGSSYVHSTLLLGFEFLTLLLLFYYLLKKSFLSKKERNGAVKKTVRMKSKTLVPRTCQVMKISF